jgi:hypothetical protein
LTVNKSIVEYLADQTLIDRNDLSGFGFTLVAAENIVNADNGEIITKNGEVARNIYGYSVGNFHVDADGNAVIEELPLGKYILRESTQQSGTVLNSKEYPVEFIQKRNGLIYAFATPDSDPAHYDLDSKNNPCISKTVSIENETTKYSFAKVDVDGKKGVSGAVMNILDQSGNKVFTWTTDGNEHTVEGLRVGNTYLLHEESAPTGYVTAEDVKFVVQNNGEVQKIAMIEKQVSVSKKDAEGNELEQVQLTVVDQSGRIVDQWISDGTGHNISGLHESKHYVLKETQTPVGYVTASDIPFTVSGLDGTGRSKTDQHIDMIDMIYRVSKVDADKNGLSDADLEVTDKFGNVIDTWTSTDTAHKVKGLNAGQSYTLKEINVPDGYIKANDIAFTINDDGTDQSTEMIDMQYRSIKADAENNGVSGAVMEVCDTDENVIDTWTTDGTGLHNISGLIAGHEYVLSETTAPKGHVKANDIAFKVEDNGTDQSSKMIDMTYNISKVTADGDAVNGAVMNILDADGNTVDIWTTDGTVHKAEGLVAGASYVLKEAQTPDGYVKANDIAFTVADNGTDQSTKMTDMVYSITKIAVGGAAVSGADMSILDAEGNVVDTWTTDGNAHNTSGLIAGGKYTLRENEAPEGYVKASDIAFIVLDNGTDQNTEMLDKQLLTVKADTGINGLAGASLAILDSEGC